MKEMPLDAASAADLFRTIETDTTQMVTVFGAVFALLNCFLGFRLKKLWATIAGFVLGFVLGFAVSMPFVNNAGISTLIGLAVGLGLGAASFALYKAGVFVLCFFLTASFCLQVIPIDWLALIVGAALGIFAGVLAMKYMRYVTIFTSAVSGGTGAASTLLPLFGCTLEPLIWGAGILLAAGGVAVQLMTTGKRRGDL